MKPYKHSAPFSSVTRSTCIAVKTRFEETLYREMKHTLRPTHVLRKRCANGDDEGRKSARTVTLNCCPATATPGTGASDGRQAEADEMTDTWHSWQRTCHTLPLSAKPSYPIWLPGSWATREHRHRTLLPRTIVPNTILPSPRHSIRYSHWN